MPNVTKRFFTKKPVTLDKVIDYNKKTESIPKKSERVSVFRKFYFGFGHFIKTTFWSTFQFLILLCIYFLYQGFIKIISFSFISPKIRILIHPKTQALYLTVMKKIEGNRPGTISKIDLIELAIKNMRFKKTRSIITIGGMAIGIGSIVFLVSIGYGLQELVVNRIARLDEMKQADISPQTGSQVTLNDKTISSLKGINGVVSVLPMISVVGRVNYQNSISDMAVYGVTTEYLSQSAIKPTKGTIFTSNTIATTIIHTKGEVAGISTENIPDKDPNKFSEQIIEFSVAPNEWVKVRSEANTKGDIIGYTKKESVIQQGIEVVGSNYITEDKSALAVIDENGEKHRKWIKSSVLLWQKKVCKISEGDCEAGNYVVARDANNQQKRSEGYFAEINILIDSTNVSKIPASSPSKDVLAAETSATNSDFIEIASESSTIKDSQTKKVSLSTKALKQAVVNRAMLKVLNIKENEAVGKTFQVSFVVASNLLSNSGEKIESEPTQYTIVGVTPDENVAFFYVPFIDLRGLGVTNFSQIKLISKDIDGLKAIRTQVETMGYSTSSVADTVSQINSLFGTARTVLALLGMVALAVAAGGMFNTLTVSLLERTREVGLMKAMGMKSSEIRELFLTESMVMGFFGGVMGIVVGLVAGKLVGIIISIFTIPRGLGYIDISYLPLPFILIVLFLSLNVGIFTGIYPARRATKISALNALRYE